MGRISRIERIIAALQNVVGSSWESVSTKEVLYELTVYPKDAVFWGPFAEELTGPLTDKLLEEYVSLRIEDMQNLYKTWKFPKDVYRCIHVSGIEEIDLKEMGVSWGHDEKAANCWVGGNPRKGPEYTLKAIVDADDVNWPLTYAENIIMFETWESTMAEEREIALETGRPITLVAYKEKNGDWVEVNLEGKV